MAHPGRKLSLDCGDRGRFCWRSIWGGEVSTAVYCCPLAATLGDGSQRATLAHQGSQVESRFWAGLLESPQAGIRGHRAEVSHQLPLALSKLPNQCKAGQS